MTKQMPPGRAADGYWFYLGENNCLLAAPLKPTGISWDKSFKIFSKNHGADQLPLDKRRRYRQFRLDLIDLKNSGRWPWR